MDKIVVIGSGGHAGVVIDILEEMNKYQIVGIITNDIFPNSKFNNYDILGDDSALQSLIMNGINKVAIGIGGFNNNVLRKEIFCKLKEIGFEIVSIIHPKTVIAKSTQIDEGSVIFAGVVINPNVSIGKNVIIATGATIDHETVIKDHVLVSAGVTVGANDIIQEGALLALGSNIISDITVGRNVLIGAGAVVVKDCLEPGTYLGIPARKVK